MLPVCAPAALERPEGVAQQDYVAMEEFQQRTNAVSLEKVKAYYRRLRYAESAAARRGPPAAPGAFHLFKKGKFSPLAASTRCNCTFTFYLLKDKAKGWALSKARAASLISGSADVFQGLCPEFAQRYVGIL